MACFLSCLAAATSGRKTDEPPLSTGALVGISIGVGVVVLVVLIICFVVYRRQKKQIDEYKEIYFLRQSDYQVFCEETYNLVYCKLLSFQFITISSISLYGEWGQRFNFSKTLTARPPLPKNSNPSPLALSPLSSTTFLWAILSWAFLPVAASVSFSSYLNTKELLNVRA